MNPIIRRAIILGTPLALGILTLFHPGVPTGAFEDLAPQVDWWITLHLLQLVLFCLLGLSAYLLLDGVQGTAATFSRIALGVFVIFYPAADTILGISTGILIRYANGLPDFPQTITAQAIDTLFSGDPIASVIATLGGFGWGIGILLAAVALSRPAPALSRLSWSHWLVIIPALLVGLAIAYYHAVNILLVYELIPTDQVFVFVIVLAVALGMVVRPRLAVGLLVMAAYLFGVSHAPPNGPSAMACYFVAALQLEFFTRRNTLVGEDSVAVEKDLVPAEEEEVVPHPS